MGERRCRCSCRPRECNYGAIPRGRSIGFPDVTVRNLSKETFQIREKLGKAKATVLLVSSPDTALNSLKDWCTPYKRQFVDHPDVQVRPFLPHVENSCIPTVVKSVPYRTNRTERKYSWLGTASTGFGAGR